MVVVQNHVMSPAQKNAVGDVGPSVISLPLVDVKGFATRPGTIAVEEATSAVSNRETGALPFREQAVGASYVDTLAVVIELDRHDSRVADQSLNRLDRHGIGMPFDMPESAARGEVVLGDDDPNCRSLTPEELSGVRTEVRDRSPRSRKTPPARGCPQWISRQSRTSCMR